MGWPMASSPRRVLEHPTTPGMCVPARPHPNTPAQPSVPRARDGSGEPCLPAAAPKLGCCMAGTRGAECQERDVGDPVPSLPTPASQGMAKQAQLAVQVPGFGRLISPLISSLAGMQPGSQAAESTPVPAGIRGCSLPRLRMWGDGSCPSIPQRQGKDAAGACCLRVACSGDPSVGARAGITPYPCSPLQFA